MEHNLIKSTNVGGLNERQLNIICSLSKRGNSVDLISNITELSPEIVIEGLAQIIGLTGSEIKIILRLKNEKHSLEEISRECLVEIQKLDKIFPEETIQIRSKNTTKWIAISIAVLALIFSSQIKFNVEDEEHTMFDGRKCKLVSKDWKFEGEATCTWPDGKSYTGTIKDTKMNGKGTLKFFDGSTYSGDFKEDKITGEGVYIGSDGSKYTGTWKDDKRNGEAIYIWFDGRSFTGQWEDDKKQRKGTHLWKDGVNCNCVWDQTRDIEKEHCFPKRRKT